jgi:hypothetical protein
VFFVSNDRTGQLIIRNSTLRANPCDGWWTRPYRGVFYLSGRPLKLVNSTLK